MKTKLALVALALTLISLFWCAVASGQERGAPVLVNRDPAPCTATTPPGTPCVWQALAYCSELSVASQPCLWRPQPASPPPPCPPGPPREAGDRFPLRFVRTVGDTGPEEFTGAFYVNAPFPLTFVQAGWKIQLIEALGGECPAFGPESLYEASGALAISCPVP